MKYLPNALTIFRILLTPVLLVLLMSNTLAGQLVAWGLFVVAAISDYLDGKIARSLQVRSRLGQFLDPFADKVLVLGTFTALVFLIPEIVPWWAVLLIALRDAVVTALRSWAEARGMSLRTMRVAKTKTLSQLIFLILMLLLLATSKAPGAWGDGARWIMATPIPFVVLLGVVLFTVATGVIYLVRQDYSSHLEVDA